MVPATWRAMTVVVHRIVVVVGEVPSPHVVHEAVAVVVDPVVGDLAGIDEDVRRQIGMRVVDARVDDRHEDARRSSEDIPSMDGANVGARGSTRLADVAQTPEARELRVVGNERRVQHIVGFDVDDVRVGPVSSDGLLDIEPSDAEVIGIDRGVVPQLHGAEIGENELAILGGGALAKLDEDLAQLVLRGGYGRMSGKCGEEPTNTDQAAPAHDAAWNTIATPCREHCRTAATGEHGVPRTDALTGVGGMLGRQNLRCKTLRSSRRGRHVAEAQARSRAPVPAARFST